MVMSTEKVDGDRKKLSYHCRCLCSRALLLQLHGDCRSNAVHVVQCVALQPAGLSALFWRVSPSLSVNAVTSARNAFIAPDLSRLPQTWSCAWQDEMETLMSRIDLNDNGNIEFEEFAAGMLDWRQMQVQSHHLL